MSGAELADSLEEYGGWLAAAGATVMTLASPGLPSDIVRSALYEVGVEASDEVVAWFGWRNGCPIDVLKSRGVLSHSIWLVPGGQFFDLRSVIEGRRMNLVTNAQVMSAQTLVPDEPFWRPTWLPLLRLNGGAIVAISDGGPLSSVRRVYWHPNPTDLEWPSLAAFARDAVSRTVTGEIFVNRSGVVDGPWPEDAGA